MIIKKIELVNFGPYFEKHELEFNNDGHGVHLVRGGNGQGKTSMQRAVLWALYGEVKDNKKGKIIPYKSLLNKTAKKQDVYQFGVRLFCSTNDGEKLVISRKTKAKTFTEKTLRNHTETNVLLDDEPIPDPDHYIMRKLPQDVSRFYFFDGEMLRDYEELLEGESTALALLKNSIESVLGVPHLKTARDDLEAIQSLFERERNKIIKKIGGDDADELSEQLQDAETYIQGIKETNKSIEKQIGEINEAIIGLKRRQKDLKEVEELTNKRDGIDKDIQLQQEKKDKLVIQQQNILKGLHKIILLPITKNLLDKFKIKSDESTAKYRKKVREEERKEQVTKAMSKQKCNYCGTVLDKKQLKQFEGDLKDIDAKIEELTQWPEPDYSYEQYIDRLNKMTSDIIKYDDLSTIEKEMTDIDYEVAKLTNKLNNVREKLRGADTKEPREIQKLIDENTEEKGRLTGVKEEKRKEMLDYLEHKSILEQKINSIPGDQLKKLRSIIAYTDEIKNIFQEAVSMYRDEQRNAVEKEATQIFKKIRSKNHFTHLTINDHYGLSIVTELGDSLNKTEWRSAGEEQLVAISLIGALNKSAQIQAPVFMDTPFSRLDMNHGERVLSYLPELSEQVVLFATDREFRIGDEKYLGSHLKTDLTVSHKGEKEGCIISLTTGGK